MLVANCFMHRSNSQVDAVVSGGLVFASTGGDRGSYHFPARWRGAEESAYASSLAFGRRNWFHTPCYQKSTQAIVDKRGPWFCVKLLCEEVSLSPSSRAKIKNSR
jgi:hypothetical protein